MSQEKFAVRLEELMVNAAKANSLCCTLFTVFYCQEDNAIENFEWAFSLLGDMTDNMWMN